MDSFFRLSLALCLCGVMLHSKPRTKESYGATIQLWSDLGFEMVALRGSNLAVGQHIGTIWIHLVPKKRVWVKENMFPKFCGQKKL